MVDLIVYLDAVCLKQFKVLKDEDTQSALRAALGIEVAIVVVMFFGGWESRSSWKVDAPQFETANSKSTTPGNYFMNY